MTPRPEIRLSDAEREAAVTALGEHYAAGRLTKEEYDGRADQAWAARYASHLAPLFVDLPVPHAGRSAAPTTRPARPTAPVSRPWSRLPMVPLLLMALGLTLLFGKGPLLLVVLGIWWIVASLRWRRRWASRSAASRGTAYRWHAPHTSYRRW